MRKLCISALHKIKDLKRGFLLGKKFIRNIEHGVCFLSQPPLPQFHSVHSILHAVLLHPTLVLVHSYMIPPISFSVDRRLVVGILSRGRPHVRLSHSILVFPGQNGRQDETREGISSSLFPFSFHRRNLAAFLAAIAAERARQG